ncbi:uncharacterized protein si:ch211-133n4.6 [Mugil cephalus]|uniref:uncharacterized protein si:ch211-133n4.6 n=1 Tax=Mugil cephalus TaxID=48193 RepID=UPI001FB77A70|nr:uncharacterized protein si:ch211-133n4.6 [Mugil cephalus]
MQTVFSYQLIWDRFPAVILSVPEVPNALSQSMNSGFRRPYPPGSSWFPLVPPVVLRLSYAGPGDSLTCEDARTFQDSRRVLSFESSPKSFYVCRYINLQRTLSSTTGLHRENPSPVLTVAHLSSVLCPLSFILRPVSSIRDVSDLIMLTRNLVFLVSLVLMVEGDLDSNDTGIQAMSTDKDSTSDEAPTESMNAVSPDQPDEFQFHGGGPADTSSSSSEAADAPTANHVTAPEPVAVAAANSVEEEDEDENADSDEGGKKKFASRSSKPQSPAHTHLSQVHDVQRPGLSLPPVVPQPKALARRRTSKRRAKTNRRQI